MIIDLHDYYMQYHQRQQDSLESKSKRDFEAAQADNSSSSKYPKNKI